LKEKTPEITIIESETIPARQILVTVEAERITGIIRAQSAKTIKGLNRNEEA
jgi:hypothetical protein